MEKSKSHPRSDREKSSKSSFKPPDLPGFGSPDCVPLPKDVKGHWSEPSNGSGDTLLAEEPWMIALRGISNEELV